MVTQSCVAFLARSRFNRRVGPLAAVALALLAVAACGGERGAEPGPTAPPGAAAVAPQADASPGEQLDEASARRLIAARLRAAGLRVVEDVPLRADGLDVTLDGFDPARRVGYEYVAADERGADLDDGERARLAGLGDARVLVVDSAGAEQVTAAVERFAADLAAP
jgi:hypothetical protein